MNKLMLVITILSSSVTFITWLVAIWIESQKLGLTGTLFALVTSIFAIITACIWGNKHEV